MTDNNALKEIDAPVPGHGQEMSGNGFSLSAASNYDEAVKFAKLIAASDMVPKDYRNKPGNVLVAAEMGANLGLKPMQAIQNIAVINGRPAIWGDLLIAVVMAHKLYRGHEESFDPETKTATATFRRQCGSEVVEFTESFSWDDAVRAGLAKKDLYAKYPKRMLGWRAKAYAARTAFADALKGIGLREELYGTAEPEPTIVQPATDVSQTDRFTAMLEDKTEDDSVPEFTIDHDLIDAELAEPVSEDEELEAHFQRTVEAEQ